MPEAEYRQLVENIREDRGLTSVPLVYRGTVLSGNHRVRAAIEAGIEEAECMEIVTEISEQQQIAIQLAQNAISGRDDPNILSQLYTSLSVLNLKKYTGLTDDVMKCDEATLKSMGIARPRYEEISLVFLPEDKQAFLELLERLQASKKTKTVIVGSLDDFDAFFNAVVDVKQQRNILNNAQAVRAIAQLTHEYLEVRDKAAATPT